MAVNKAETEKTYGLMGVMQGTSPRVETKAQEVKLVRTWPNLLMREIVAFMALFAVLTVISIFFDAPLEGVANPSVTPNPAKAPWYFLGLQELLHYFHPLLAGVIMPGVAVGALMVLPYLDKNPSRRFRDRRWAIAIFTIMVVVNIVLIIIGVYFRGPGWAWVWPWATTLQGH